MPVYGNLLKWVQEKVNNDGKEPIIIYSVPEINWQVNFSTNENAKNFDVKRKIGANEYELFQSTEKYKEIYVPFVTHGIKSSIELLSDTVGKSISLINDKTQAKLLENIHFPAYYVKTQRTDSLLKPMMHRSDNFFAEQSC
jgi:D-alanyl-D-alanine carboxypeptidase/D-alanyl-D-alanine-endopeptidase (penicillin-binding protein 4)